MKVRVPSRDVSPRPKRSKPAAEPTKGKGKGKAVKAKPAPQPGRWVDWDCSSALNMQRIGKSRWRPLELCFWPNQGALPAKGKEYPGLGYKRLRDKPPKAQEQQQQPAEAQMQRNRQRKRNRNASDIEIDRELEAQPDQSQVQKNKKASGEARRDRKDKNTWHAKKAKRHTLMRGVCAAGLEAGAVVACEVVEARLATQIEAWVEVCSMRALLGSLLLGLMVRGWFTRVRVLPDGQEVFEEIPAEDAVIPDLADRNMCLQLCRGLVEQAVALAGARVIAGSHEHQRRFGLPLGGRPAWTRRQRSWVECSVQGKELHLAKRLTALGTAPLTLEKLTMQSRTMKATCSCSQQLTAPVPRLAFDPLRTHRRGVVRKAAADDLSPVNGRVATSITFPSGDFCIIESRETVKDFAKMQLDEIGENIAARQSKIFLLMEEVRRLRIQQRLKSDGTFIAPTAAEELAKEEFNSALPFLPPLNEKSLNTYFIVYAAFVLAVIIFGGLLAPVLQLKLGLGGTTYQDFVDSMQLPSQLAQVDPIVASFCGGSVGALSVLLVVEVNNVKKQQRNRQALAASQSRAAGQQSSRAKMCHYCEGTGYLSCGNCVGLGREQVSSSELQVLGMGGAKAAPICACCAGTGKVMCTGCLCTGKQLATEHDPRIDPFSSKASCVCCLSVLTGSPVVMA
ncbi:hypothetical protein QJQ45_018902 [Haematococcus lacustris]|nr:hypothetical protein QJQ45_018902 [Haematococcus lacustris]